MTDKQERIKALEARLNLVRGRLIGSYSFVEFILGDLYVRAQRMPAYSSVRDRFPVKLRDRIIGIEQILDIRGPLDPYAEKLRELIGGIAAYADLRHFLAHGHGVIRHASDRHNVELRLYRPQPDKTWKIELHTTTIDELEKVYARLNPYAHEVWAYFKEIYLNLNIDQVQDT
ncbi:hypothetical protein [Methylobacterium gnaphalii]|uniref:Uncharacterized protein n=1 Tax=Methylobacterium gnaphalii TaxID=1010610 RepID=A0A512JIS3_9HYPH|nr:hypothetical protein [Methylobacterium gnaphalii]GEP09823.1 hypothetical protein MGN01_16680 [Methylobacterium gnaphalii]GJD67262.1 hypothetical protein MMMDOFMJ_0176 [Methylobacterium gnaphalii]GLS49853.1 hypothetical protein GCM10007885_27050 [Methylobacterium gnaphalii]